MDFDSPDVEKDFPGLCDTKSRKSKEESDYSESDQVSRKDLLIGRRKDKKDKGKANYATLEGESSPEEEPDAKSPSKHKKTKAFKFSSSKSKVKSEKENKDEEKSITGKDKPEKDQSKEHKKKEKERKEKDKKEKSKDKDKDKKDKKSKHHSSSITGASEEILELGDVQPVFGVSISLAAERSRCHDGSGLPLVVRECIDFLQEHSLKNDQIYKVEPVKTRLQHFKRLYSNREKQPEDEIDMPTACGLLKLFLKDLPEPVLTTDLIARFEEVAAHPEVTKQQEELKQLLDQLPQYNRILLAWILLHFDSIIQNEKYNKMNAQSLAMLLSPPLQMSHRLLVTLLCHCSSLFPDTKLDKYAPPLNASSPKLPETRADIQIELAKQESLLAQIHAEMNAGFVSKKREEQLWEVQRIITQLKRKLRSFEKNKENKSVDEISTTAYDPVEPKTRETVKSVNEIHADSTDLHLKKFTSSKSPQDTEVRVDAKKITSELLASEQQSQHAAGLPAQLNPDGLYVDVNSGFLMLPKTHPDYAQLIQLQLENQELINWKTQLQTRISAERAEILRLKQLCQQQEQQISKKSAIESSDNSGGDYEKIIEHYIRENALLEHKKIMLAKEIFDERRELIALQVELAMKQF